MEERAVLRPVPDKHFRIKELQKRIISPDLFISVDGSKYTVPAKYALKTMYFRVVYGFRIEIYDKNKKLVLTLEKSEGQRIGGKESGTLCRHCAKDQYIYTADT